jgi:hypothetical protein
VIQTPIHGSFPSGHCTEAHAVAWVLNELVTQHSTNADAKIQLRETLMRQAARIAINRTVAGVHFPVDSMAGQMLGFTVGEYFIARAKPEANTTNVGAWAFDGTKYADVQSNTFDFTGNELFNATTGKRLDDKPYAEPVGGKANPQLVRVMGSDNLNWLWSEASEEWEEDK